MNIQFNYASKKIASNMECPSKKRQFSEITMSAEDFINQPMQLSKQNETKSQKTEMTSLKRPKLYDGTQILQVDYIKQFFEIQNQDSKCKRQPFQNVHMIDLTISNTSVCNVSSKLTHTSYQNVGIILDKFSVKESEKEFIEPIKNVRMKSRRSNSMKNKKCEKIVIKSGKKTKRKGHYSPSRKLSRISEDMNEILKTDYKRPKLSGMKRNNSVNEERLSQELLQTAGQLIFDYTDECNFEFIPDDLSDIAVIDPMEGNGMLSLSQLSQFQVNPQGELIEMTDILHSVEQSSKMSHLSNNKREQDENNLVILSQNYEEYNPLNEAMILEESVLILDEPSASFNNPVIKQESLNASLEMQLKLTSREKNNKATASQSQWPIWMR